MIAEVISKWAKNFLMFNFTQIDYDGIDLLLLGIWKVKILEYKKIRIRKYQQKYIKTCKTYSELPIKPAKNHHNQHQHMVWKNSNQLMEGIA